MARRRLQTFSLALAGLCVVGTLFFWSRVHERDRLLDGLTTEALASVAPADTHAVVRALSEAIYLRTGRGLPPDSIRSVYDRWEATSFFNVGTGVALKYGMYGVIGHGTYGPCGTMSRVLLAALWRRGIPARKLQLLPGPDGTGGEHTMVEYRTGNRWNVISPSDSSFVWRNRAGQVATVEEIRRDPQVFAQIYAVRPRWEYRFDAPSNIRWEKLPRPVRSALRAVLGPERYAKAKTPALYDKPRHLFLLVSLGGVIFFAGLFYLIHPHGHRGPP
jgi:hypothetical protein